MPPLYRTTTLASWRRMPALRVQQSLSPRESPLAPLCLMRAPIQCDRWNHLPRYAPASDKVVSRHDASLRIEERNVRLPDSTLAWRELQDGLVSVPSDSRGHAGSGAGKTGRHG